MNDCYSDVLNEPHDVEYDYYIGMMSGTSLDALDAVLCRFIDDKPVIIATHSLPFTPKLRQLLLALCTPNGIVELAVGDQSGCSELDFWGLASRDYAYFATQIVDELLAKSTIHSSSITAIGCHGQTVRHRPEWGFSLQLLDPNILAERTGIAVVSDFRRRDMAVGGQGAPLVPAFHQAIFSRADTDGAQIVLNLGGIANITVLSEHITGYDTGVANLLMDAWASRHLGMPYDKGGAWAKSGRINDELLKRLMNHPFLTQSAPKSTGREEFNMTWLDGILSDFIIKPQDVQATLCEFTALSASREIDKFSKGDNTLYICGGGAYNDHLLDRLAHLLPTWRITTTELLGISPSWVEATAFAWLARQTILMQTGNVPAVTGADKGVVLGQVCF